MKRQRYPWYTVTLNDMPIQIPSDIDNLDEFSCRGFARNLRTRYLEEKDVKVKLYRNEVKEVELVF